LDDCAIQGHGGTLDCNVALIGLDGFQKFWLTLLQNHLFQSSIKKHHVHEQKDVRTRLIGMGIGMAATILLLLMNKIDAKTAKIAEVKSIAILWIKICYKAYRILESKRPRFWLRG
jgi:hypothetical protein